ncbi:MAG: hypothetical protein ACRDLQ_11620 [Solirubrobacterales bacterium]
MPESLADPEVGMLYDVEPESERLIVVFGGLAGGLGMPPFEFFRTLSEVDVKTVFVRDSGWLERFLLGLARRRPVSQPSNV